MFWILGLIRYGVCRYFHPCSAPIKEKVGCVSTFLIMSFDAFETFFRWMKSCVYYLLSSWCFGVYT